VNLYHFSLLQKYPCVGRLVDEFLVGYIERSCIAENDDDLSALELIFLLTKPFFISIRNPYASVSGFQSPPNAPAPVVISFFATSNRTVDFSLYFPTPGRLHIQRWCHLDRSFDTSDFDEIGRYISGIMEGTV
jgi:hypothetical protein